MNPIGEGEGAAWASLYISFLWSVVMKCRLNTGLTRLLIKVKGPIFIDTGSDVYEYQKYRV